LRGGEGGAYTVYQVYHMFVLLLLPLINNIYSTIPPAIHIVYCDLFNGEFIYISCFSVYICHKRMRKVFCGCVVQV